jgi:hypothetical protein
MTLSARLPPHTEDLEIIIAKNGQARLPYPVREATGLTGAVHAIIV